jgi:phosphate-selective porin OprO and OprP
MKNTQNFAYRVMAGAVLATLPFSVLAEEPEAATRIQQLEKMMQQMQQQREEQDKQMQVMADELKAMQQQMANGKEERVKEKGKATGSPVYAAFKDGLVFEDGSGNWKLQLNGRVQADYRDYDPSEWKNDTFSIRRARFGGTFSFLKDFAVRVEGEYANTTGSTTTALTYGYLDYTRWAGAKIRAGQFKPFFGLERAYSTNFIDFTELSLATNNGTIFNSTYDRGVMLFGDPLPWLNYNLYAINGTGQNQNDVDNQKDTGGRVNANLARLAEIKNAVLHVGASASTGDLGFTSTTGAISQSTESQGVSFFNVGGLDTDSKRKRWGIETALSYGPVKFQSEYISANFDGDWTNSKKQVIAYDNDINNWYADLNWLVTGESYADSYKGGVFGRVRPKNNFDDKGGWGAFELGLRYSKFDASDFSSMLANSATSKYTSEADAWTAGAKWILNPNARLVLNYIHTSFDTPVTSNGRTDDQEDAIVLRAQYDF